MLSSVSLARIGLAAIKTADKLFVAVVSKLKDEVVQQFCQLS